VYVLYVIIRINSRYVWGRNWIFTYLLRGICISGIRVPSVTPSTGNYAIYFKFGQLSDSMTGKLLTSNCVRIHYIPCTNRTTTCGHVVVVGYVILYTVMIVA